MWKKWENSSDEWGECLQDIWRTAGGEQLAGLHE